MNNSLYNRIFGLQVTSWFKDRIQEISQSDKKSIISRTRSFKPRYLKRYLVIKELIPDG